MTASTELFYQSEDRVIPEPGFNSNDFEVPAVDELIDEPLYLVDGEPRNYKDVAATGLGHIVTANRRVNVFHPDTFTTEAKPARSLVELSRSDQERLPSSTTMMGADNLG